MINKEKLLNILLKCWSSQTSSKWAESNPARGQCSVTALIIQNKFGGRILKTKVGDSWHFYNEIDGMIYDFTASQFPKEIIYRNEPATYKEALNDTTIEQYNILLEQFSKHYLQ